MSKKKLLKILSSIVVVYLLFKMASCSHTAKSHADLITVNAASPSTHLFYTGTIQPLHVTVVPSPADGIVSEQPFHYGEKVKAGQWIFSLSSQKFLADYKTALMQYIKAKSDFDTSKIQWNESQFLHKNQLISDDDYKMRQSNFYAAQLSLVQAKDALEILLQQLSIKNIDLYQLTISDIDKITAAMHLKITAENIKVFAPVAGTILAANRSEGESKRIEIGEIVKQGDALAAIGDMSGFSVYVNVNEVTVNQLKVGQAVRMTGVAFPSEVLSGEITRIDQQGEALNGAAPTFHVEMAVSHLTKEQQRLIHVGMTANVEVIMQDAAQIIIPLTALYEKDGVPTVRIWDKQDEKTKEVTVMPGKTSMTGIIILKGLKKGDEIVATH
ncbi:MAG TPA: efflux RND transporter periplasmic adaptor subunit [Gammaproteobacteria bacterium]|jgi:multidrug efflux pump subunit AcrA (membrane-fusion protein)|nr:efflux RND transporter periplasmic adaptor subunit [Gammaproteobacteria bacterium]